jgi:hypothetical protein
MTTRNNLNSISERANLRTMRLPGYNAEAAVYKTSNQYHTFSVHDALNGHQKILPSQMTGGGGLAYTCDSDVGSCTCIGAVDCFRLGRSGKCGSVGCDAEYQTCSCKCTDKSNCKSS